MYSKPTLSGFNTGKFLPVNPSGQHAPETRGSLTAWQRWEMTSFAEALHDDPSAAAAPESALEPLEPVLLIDEAELTRLRLLAQKTGEAEGYEKGFARGQAEGHAAGLAAMQAQAKQLQALTQALPAALRMAQASVADDLLALAMDIAKQVLGKALKLDPQAILPLVHELLQAEPALTGAPQLLLHPDDAALVQEHLADDLKNAGWRMRMDAQTTRGGCRVLASSGEKDATLETRWERVTATLARNTPPAPPIVADPP